LYLQRYKSVLKDRIYFHLINADFVKMNLHRLKILKKLKNLLKKPMYKKFSIFNFIRLKKFIKLLKIKIEIKDLFYKKLQVKKFYKANLFKLKYFNFLKNIFLKKNIKYVFFKRNLIRKNKHIHKLCRNYTITIKKKLSYKLKLYFFFITRLLNLKDLFYGILFLNNEYIESFYDIKLNKFLNIKILRMFLKFNFWVRKRQTLKYKLLRKYTRDYKLVYRVKPYFDSDDDLRPLQLI